VSTRDAMSTTMAMKTHRNIFYTRVRARVVAHASSRAEGKKRMIID
jgi:predicted GNAT family acetyltransferase